jgi:hypothetical protein
MNRRLFYLLTLVSGALVLAALALWWPQAQAEAQCGSQASSCKNCHEVQGKKPVNNDGTSWHPSHAFGDFCANCHAGNVQATDATGAHTGMLAPLSDIKANCAACHPSDTEARAQKYAAILGVQIGGSDSNSSGGTTSGSDGTGTSSNSTPTTPATPTTLAPAPTAAAVASGEGVPGLVDYNRQYAETVQGRWPINWGNVILGLLIVLVAGGGGTYAYFNERKLRRLATGAASRPSGQPASSEGAAAGAPADLQAELAELQSQLEKLDPRSLRALKQILREPEMANGLLLTLARLDPRLIEEVRRLDRREVTLLVALAEEK